MNLAHRARNYLNNAFLKSKQNANMPITKALLKYDQLNFTLLILEYVEPEFLTTLCRETFYWMVIITSELFINAGNWFIKYWGSAFIFL